MNTSLKATRLEVYWGFFLWRRAPSVITTTNNHNLSSEKLMPNYFQQGRFIFKWHFRLEWGRSLFSPWWMWFLDWKGKCLRDISIIKYWMRHRKQTSICNLILIDSISLKHCSSVFFSPKRDWKHPNGSGKFNSISWSSTSHTLLFSPSWGCTASATSSAFTVFNGYQLGIVTHISITFCWIREYVL